jgi:hypothetical protein
MLPHARIVNGGTPRALGFHSSSDGGGPLCHHIRIEAIMKPIKMWSDKWSKPYGTEK